MKLCDELMRIQPYLYIHVYTSVYSHIRTYDTCMYVRKCTYVFTCVCVSVYVICKPTTLDKKKEKKKTRKEGRETRTGVSFVSHTEHNNNGTAKPGRGDSSGRRRKVIWRTYRRPGRLSRLRRRPADPIRVTSDADVRTTFRLSTMG